MKLISYWWPVGMSPTAGDLLDGAETKLKYGVQPQLVDLQPYILRWAFVWVALTLLYSTERWLPVGTGRTIFIFAFALLWLVSVAAFVFLLIMQKQRRQAAESTRAEPDSESESN